MVQGMVKWQGSERKKVMLMEVVEVDGEKRRNVEEEEEFLRKKRNGKRMLKEKKRRFTNEK